MLKITVSLFNGDILRIYVKLFQTHTQPLVEYCFPVFRYRATTTKRQMSSNVRKIVATNELNGDPTTNKESIFILMVYVPSRA